MRILYVTYGLPFPPNTGARLRDFHLIRHVGAQHDVHLLSLLESDEEADHLPSARAICSSVDTVVMGGRVRRRVQALIPGLLRRRPIATVDYYEPALARRLRQLTAERRFDIVQIEHSLFAPYRAAIDPAHSCRTVLSFHNVGCHQYRSMLGMQLTAGERGSYWVKSLLMRNWEARLVGGFDQAITVSTADRELLLRQGTRTPVTVVENGVDCSQYMPLPEPPDTPELLFVGTMGYRPNLDAAEFLLQDIFPRIAARVPQVRVSIVGHGGREKLAQWVGHDAVDVTGSVADVRPYYGRASVVVAPLRAGGGTRLKILEAMALGRPVVCTRKASEGLNAEDGRHLLLADDPAAFAEATCRLLATPDLRASLVRAARQRVERRYDWRFLAGRLLETYDHLLEAA